jgi:hypothetical protein
MQKDAKDSENSHIVEAIGIGLGGGLFGAPVSFR